MRPRTLAVPFVIALLASVASCNQDEPDQRARSFFMGFSAIPPSNDPALQLPTLNMAAAHSDAGLIQLSVPWSTLLGGTSAPDEVRMVRLPLVQYYRGGGRVIVVALDVTDGLDRSAEDPELVALGKSITDPAIQQVYREYVAAVDTILRPEYLSLAAETNLVRAIAPASLYSAVVTMTNDAAAERRADATTATLMVSVQVEVAWGKLQGGPYVGIAQDRTDFPFLDALGLSSYPYLAGYADPDAVPEDYYSRIVAGDPLPEVVLEGGWPSRDISAQITSTPAEQARYIARQAALLDKAGAAGLLQITFTDLAVSSFPPPTNTSLVPFAYNGLVDTVLAPKPALTTWDSVFAIRYRP
ncbi:MAG TPA: hypothetical protein VH438_01075 [Gemmatimonadales bacterium]